MHESMFATMGLGFVLGLKHATEADHLAAVSTIVSERRSLWQSSAIGLLWGIGHTGSLLAAGVVVLGLGVVIPESVANSLELVVALMIVFLGMRLLRMHVRTHSHRGRSHVHLHFRDEQNADNEHSGLPGWRPVLVGIVHGLAGSATLTLLVLSQVARSGGVGFGFAYLVVFGLGSIGGMLIMSTLIGLPFFLGVRFFERSYHPLRLLTGILSTTFGAAYAWEIARRLSLL
jgi:cytochrome c biogenesis protein CcdA